MSSKNPELKYNLSITAAMELCFRVPRISKKVWSAMENEHTDAMDVYVIVLNDVEDIIAKYDLVTEAVVDTVKDIIIDGIKGAEMAPTMMRWYAHVAERVEKKGGNVVNVEYVEEQTAAEAEYAAAEEAVYTAYASEEEAEYEEYGFSMEDEKELKREAEEAEGEIDKHLQGLFEALAKASALFGVDAIREDVCAILTKDSGWSLNSLKEMGRECYNCTVRHINRVAACGDIKTARELRTLFGEGRYNIFEAVLGSIACIISNLNNKVKDKLHIDIKNKLLSSAVEKIKGFCTVMRKAATAVLKAVAKGASLVVAFSLKTAAFVVKGLKWVVVHAIRAVKSLCIKTKNPAPEVMEEAVEEMFSKMAGNTAP